MTEKITNYVPVARYGNLFILVPPDAEIEQDFNVEVRLYNQRTGTASDATPLQQVLKFGVFEMVPEGTTFKDVQKP